MALGVSRYRSQRFQTLFWRLFFPLSLSTLLASLVLMGFLNFSLQKLMGDQIRKDLLEKAQRLGAEGARFVESADSVSLQKWVRETEALLFVQVTVVDAKGNVLADSQRPSKNLGNLSDQSEVGQALDNHIGVAFRMNHPLRQKEVFVSVPLHLSKLGASVENVIGALRLGAPVPSTIGFMRRAFGLLIVLWLLIALIHWKVAQRFRQPLRAIGNQAQRIASGDFSGRLIPGPGDAQELTELALEMNEAAIQLEQRIQGILEQTVQREAVFSSMVEGIVAIDLNEQIVYMNQAASQIFDVEAQWALSRSLQEVIRHPEIQAFARHALQSESTLDKEISIFGSPHRELKLQGVPLRAASLPGRSGAVIVFYDVSRLRKLEEHRKEFVANVSHELKTPLTSLRGYLETLLDAGQTPGGMSEKERHQFYETMLRQANRLTAMIDDLLALSRMEEDEEKGGIELIPQPLRPVLEAAVQVCQRVAEEKKIRIELICPKDYSVPLNETLLEQAVVNLIENAVKYSSSGKTIEVCLRLNEKEQEVEISVKDEGIGIAAEHLQRIFERFYRVDPARARAHGGTGLGLSIVKHIAQLHGGSASVSSQEGKGSSFFIRIPWNA